MECNPMFAGMWEACEGEENWCSIYTSYLGFVCTNHCDRQINMSMEQDED